MRNIVSIAAFLLITVPFVAFSQSPVFSQYYSSGLYLNPALAGLEKDIYLGMNYRSQWGNRNLPFTTFQFSYIQPISRNGAPKRHLGGLGLSFLNDVAGSNKEFITQGVSLALARNFHLNHEGNNIVAIAIQAGASQQRINYDDLRWSSQYSAFTGYDQSLPGESTVTNERVFNPILNAGVMWYYNPRPKNLSYKSTSIFHGVSVSNIIRPDGFYLTSKDALSLLYKIHGGFTSAVSRKIELSPNYLVQWQDERIQVNLGMYVGYTISGSRDNSLSGIKALLGAWYRYQDAIIISTGLSTANWNLGFSYDSNVFSFSKAFGYGSAYELSMAYKIVSKSGLRRFSSPLI
ncbi:MAG: PorP/SprF family type IX secretion system membrane protein [Cyclobacteriaceae bacterium]